MASRSINVWKSVDKVAIVIYLILVFFGWVSIYAAGYDFDRASIFDFAERSGKQLLWIALSFVISAVILSIEARFYETYAYLIYISLILLLIATIFVAPDIKGSHSWLVLGPVSLQPAEFAKFATALALAKLFNSYNFKFTRPANFFKVVLIILLPMLLIIMQRETGSALVYLSLVLMMYREGMTGLVLFGGLCAILYFVMGIKYSDVLWCGAPLGEIWVLGIICVVMAGMVWFFAAHKEIARNLSIGYMVVAVAIAILQWVGVELPMLYLLLGVVALSVLYLLVMFFVTLAPRLLAVAAITIASVAFLFSCNYVFSSVLEPHQQMRIKVLLGMEEDLRGAGYNVNQSKIAIGSGGFWGKGFLNGTQTKLNYVPEQDTDFIFCTIGEEEGFWGSCLVIGLFTALILRIMVIAERQPRPFGRVYGYCVLSIFFLHLLVNIGMVIGLCPVIGIPLPFFSYGGSSLWGFTILLFILLRIDASRSEHF